MRRFFSPESFWNTPLGSDVKTDPRSDEFLEILSREYGGPFWINIKKYTIPVYEADASTPRVTVHQAISPPSRPKPFRQGPDFGTDVPMPEHASVDIGTDKHMAIVDGEQGIVWDMWHVEKRPDDQWESYTGMKYPIDSSGVWQTSDFAVEDGDSIHSHGPGRAAGVPIIAGLIMVDEVLAGRIEHKLAYATWYGAHKEFTAPATWTDGPFKGGIPEGAIMQIDPSLDPKDFGLSKAGEVIFRCLQEYGMVNVDCAKANTLYAEGCWSQPDRNWDGILEEEELYKVPLECYRVLELGPVTHKGDRKLRE